MTVVQQTQSGPILEPPIRAAQYVRMSTDHQDYSIQNQLALIAAYARSRNIVIVRTYPDEGRSGLRLDDRPALRELLDVVQGGAADFQVILVHDVSRWGRFQDIDESAYYEHICKRAGVRVVYCAENFENDDSLVSTLLKSLKRAMAGEYSRELSKKVFIGQCTLVQKGFWQGAQPGYALRRALIGADGRPKGILMRGERKNIQSDRVILVPGPDHEVETVKRIFHAYVNDRKTANEIAAELVVKGISYRKNRAWDKRAVRKVLTSEKYAGHIVFNRASRKLNSKQVSNEPHLWVRSENAFQAIVDPALVKAAQAIDQEERTSRSDEWMLLQLRKLLKEKGELSCKIINNALGLPHSVSYRKRFGSLQVAYERVGYRSARRCDYIETRRSLAPKFDEIIASLVRAIAGAGFDVIPIERRNSFAVDGKFNLAIVVVRLASHGRRTSRWIFQNRTAFLSDQIAAIRIDERGYKPIDYHLIPSREVPSTRFTLGGGRMSIAYKYRFETVTGLIEQIRRCASVAA
jgi:DNA invertase Pin-like site-specific DNA recombinase